MKIVKINTLDSSNIVPVVNIAQINLWYNTRSNTTLRLLIIVRYTNTLTYLLTMWLNRRSIFVLPAVVILVCRTKRRLCVGLFWLSVYRYNCVLGIRAIPAETVEPIEMPFGIASVSVAHASVSRGPRMPWWVSKQVSNKCLAVRKVATPLRELTCHMGSHSVTIHTIRHEMLV